MSSKLHFGVALLSVALLTACEASSYNRVKTGGVMRTNTELNRDSAVLISAPVQSSSANANSVVTRTLDASFSRYAAIVDVSSSEYGSGEFQQAVADNNYAYIVVPQIIRWSGQSDWSSTPAQVNVKVTVIDAATGQKISSNFLDARAPAPDTLKAAFNLDSDTPSDMLGSMADDYVDKLYGVSFFSLR